MTITGARPNGGNEIEIDDSADPATRTATLSTSTIGGMSWGNLSGPAPAGISFQYADASREASDLLDESHRPRHGRRPGDRSDDPHPPTKATTRSTWAMPAASQEIEAWTSSSPTGPSAKYHQHRRLGRPRGPDGHAQHR